MTYNLVLSQIIPMNEAIHIFLYVVRRKEDPFFGIKQQLHSIEKDCIVQDVILSENEYNHIQKIEYSVLRYFRILFYLKIFKNISKTFNNYFMKYGLLKKYFVYLSDEGVWGELLRRILDINRKYEITSINVQHGYFVPHRRLRERDSALRLRKLLNGISMQITGFPCYGYGFGKGPFDIYMLYGEVEAGFIKDNNAVHIVCPNLIKKDFILKYFNAISSRKTPKKAALFAMPAFIPGSDTPVTLNQYLRLIKPIAKLLYNNHSYRIIIRPHPGTPCDSILYKQLVELKMCAFVDIDNSNQELPVSLFGVQMVIGFNSTVLFEANLLGKLPVIICLNCENQNFSYKHKTLYMKLPLEPQIEKIVDVIGRSEIEDREFNDEVCWPLFLKEIFKYTSFRKL